MLSSTAKTASHDTTGKFWALFASRDNGLLCHDKYDVLFLFSLFCFFSEWHAEALEFFN